jgi:formylglycine-generating enzyme required for sulfatase activity
MRQRLFGFLIIGVLAVGVACGGGDDAADTSTTTVAKRTTTTFEQLPYGPGGWDFEILSSIAQTVRRVPPGEFMVGADREDEYPERSPRHKVAIAEIYIMNAPVDNKFYKKFVDDRNGYNDKAFWTKEGWDWRNANNITSPAGWEEIAGRLQSEDTEENRMPVVGVSFHEAQAFARSLGCVEGHEFEACGYKSKKYEDGSPIRLPSEEEFEVASSFQGAPNASETGDCSGQAERYPWGGEDFDRSRMAVGGRLNTVGVTPTGAAPCVGLMDVKGNILQWTTSVYKPYPGSSFTVPAPMADWIVARGADYEANDSMYELTSRTALAKQTRDRRVGFRLAVEDPTFVECIWSDIKLDCPYRDE